MADWHFRIFADVGPFDAAIDSISWPKSPYVESYLRLHLLQKMDFTHIWPSFFQVTQLDSWSPQNAGHLDLTLAKGHLDKNIPSGVAFWDLDLVKKTKKR